MITTLAVLDALALAVPVIIMIEVVTLLVLAALAVRRVTGRLELQVANFEDSEPESKGPPGRELQLREQKVKNNN